MAKYRKSNLIWLHGFVISPKEASFRWPLDQATCSLLQRRQPGGRDELEVVVVAVVVGESGHLPTYN